MSKKLKVLVLKNSEWARGLGVGSLLWCKADREQCDLPIGDQPKFGQRCCLGILAKACGISDRKTRGKDFPGDVPSLLWPDGAAENEREIGFINDSPSIGDGERIKLLRTLFAKLGYRLEYRGKE